MLHDELMDIIMDHYENPRNFGKMDHPDIEQTGGNPGCGDIITVQLKITDDKIEDVMFEIEGCIVSQAGTSLVSELVKDKTLQEVKEINSEKMKEILSKDIVIRRPQCSNLGIETIKAAIRKYEKEKVVT